MRKPGLILNYHDRDKNPCFESHDPSMMYDPVSGWCYSYSTDSAITSEFKQGIPVRKSKDLVEFEFVGYALSDAAVAEGRDNGDYPPTYGFWAPYVEYCNGEYRMYYSATKAFGSSESRIWLAVAEKPEGPFENRGVVMDTWGTTDAEPNAIDAHVVDTADGRKFFIYGSFFGGIFVKELDVTTGLSLNGDVHDLGKRIAKKPEDSYIDGPEGAAVIRVEDKYYLFLSYGWLGDDYDIRVGVSDHVEGPYVDRDGKSLDGVSLGQKLAGSYCFTAEQPYAKAVEETDLLKECGGRKHRISEPDWEFGGFRGPGHGVPFYHEPTGRYFFIHHVRDGAECLCYKPKKEGEKLSYRMHYMMVRRMYFVEGWPVFVPEAYTEEEEAERFYQHNVALAFAEKKEKEHLNEQTDFYESAWEIIEFSNTDNRMVQGKNSDFPRDFLYGVTGKAADFENGGQCIYISGYLENGNTVWMKKRG